MNKWNFDSRYTFFSSLINVIEVFTNIYFNHLQFSLKKNVAYKKTCFIITKKYMNKKGINCMKNIFVLNNLLIFMSILF